MKVACFALQKGGSITPEDEAAVNAGWRAGRGSYWCRLTATSPAESTRWLSELGLDPELIALLHLDQDDMRVLPLADAFYLSYQLSSEEDGRPAPFQVLCLDRMVITLDRGTGRAPVLDEAPLSRLQLREGTTAGLVCGLAMLHAGLLRRQVLSLRARADDLSVRMDADPWAVTLTEIAEFKRQAMRLGGIVDGKAAILEFLQASHLEVLPLSQVADTLRVAIQVTRATERDVDRLDARGADLHRRHESAESERTNRRLEQLTVLSAIFMPLTLIAGIYGMNFDHMPELHLPHAYPAVLAAMALIAGLLGWLFHSRWGRRGRRTTG